MNLYLISQNENNNYDTFDSAVVCANSEEEAKQIHPGGNTEIWDDGFSSWVSTPDKVKVKFIGIAANNIIAGSIISASFNAG